MNKFFNHSSPTDKIAIIGFSCLFPNARNPEEFWQTLICQQNSTSVATREDLGNDLHYFYDPIQSDPDKTYSLQGGFIRNLEFDTTGYHLPATLLESLDPLFQATLYTAKQALERTHYLGKQEILSKCGIILGNLSFPTPYSHQFFAPLYQEAIEPLLRELLQAEHFQLATLPNKGDLSPYNAAISSLPATIVAQALSLSGIHFCLDAACSSSLYAMKLACHQLLSGKVDLMLAGAISYADPLFTRMLFSGVRTYPDNGISCPLAKSSKGMIPADGIGMVVLKRYQDALRDGDRIHATIAGIGLSNDGKGKHLLSPNIKGQILAYERAYAEAGFSPAMIDYLECHATGTPLGDITELTSLDKFFGQYGATPLVGAVKANVGHLLTAAGMVSLIKVLLSLDHEIIPPTLTLTDVLTSPNQVITPQQVVQQATPWPKGDTPRRAAISTFGFGGTNAHLILEEGRRQEAQSSGLDIQTLNIHQSMAIVGMDAVFGLCDGIDGYERTVYEGKQHFIPLPPQRWHGMEEQAPFGAYLESLEIDAIAYKIPPNEVETLNPQQLLMLKVADRAIRDANLAPGGKVAVIIAMDMELSQQRLQQRWHLPWQIEQGLQQQNLGLSSEALAQLTALVKDSLHPAPGMSEYVGYVGNIIASRISALWDFTGLSFTLSASESSTFKALEVAQLLLATGEVEAVVVGAVDLAGGLESVSWRNQLASLNRGTPTLSHDQNANGWLVGEGAGAVVLQSIEQAQASQKSIYAAIDAISRKEVNRGQKEQEQNKQEKIDEKRNLLISADADAVKQACQEAFAVAGVKPSDIGYLEVCGSGVPDEDAAEQEGLIRAYQGDEPELSCAIGSVKANIGHTWVASGMASLIKTAMCLHHRYIPAVPQWTSPKQLQNWQKSPFYVATESRGWFLGQGTRKRIAAINSMGMDGSCSHLILSESEPQTPRNNRYLAQMPLCLFPLAARDRSSLVEALKSLEQALDTTESLRAIAEQTLTQFQAKTGSSYTLVILARNQEQLEREIEQAFVGINQAFETGKDWQTPAGSYFTAHPLGKKGKTAFVYPAAYNSYVGLARQIFRLFSSSYDCSFLAENSNRVVNSVLKQLYPRSLSKLTPRQLEALENQLLNDPMAMLGSEIGFAEIATGILQDTFQIQPDCAFGYSLGELSMMVAQGVWRNFNQGIQAFDESPLFKNRLSGSKEAVREYWNCDDLENEALWQTYILLAPVDQVREYLQHESRLYLTQISTPSEVIIAGEKQACQRAITALQCQAIRAPFNHVIHCEAMNSEYAELVKLNTFLLDRQLDIPLYSAAQYRPFPLETTAIGQHLAQGLCQTLDFPRLVNQVYADGNRIFIEAGAGGSCSRWISEILKGQEHLCVYVNRRGIDDHTTLLKALAKLTAHGVALDLSPLYEQKSENSHPPQSLVKSITLGGCAVDSTLLGNHNKDFFSAFPLAKLPNNIEELDGSQGGAAAMQPPFFPGSIREGTPFFPSDVPNNSIELTKVPEPSSYPTMNHSQPLFSETSQRINSAPTLLKDFLLPSPSNPQYQQLSNNHSRVSQAHATFLETQQELMRQASKIIQLQLDVLNKIQNNDNEESNEFNT